MTISKRLRYEVFRRDNHACRYCGAAAPHVRLTVDHVVPTTLGGTDDPANLVTACSDCNSGKSSSPPDSPIVEDVAADAVRWANAMKRAAVLHLEAEEEEWTYVEEFHHNWTQWTAEGSTLDLLDGWESSIRNFRRAGLSSADLDYAISESMRARQVANANKFRYFCGIGWRFVERRREIAMSLLIAEEGEPPA